MNRIYIAVLALLLSFGVARADTAPKTGDPCQKGKETCWDRAQVAPYGNRSVAAALDRLVTPDLVPNTTDRQRVRALVLAGKPSWTETIALNARATRMIFGEGQILPNTVAQTDKWNPQDSHQVDIYKTTLSDGTVVLIGRPHVCSNWYIVIITPQGVCIVDQLLCDMHCQRLRKELGL